MLILLYPKSVLMKILFLKVSLKKDANKIQLWCCVGLILWRGVVDGSFVRSVGNIGYIDRYPPYHRNWSEGWITNFTDFLSSFEIEI